MFNQWNKNANETEKDLIAVESEIAINKIKLHNTTEIIYKTKKITELHAVENKHQEESIRGSIQTQHKKLASIERDLSAIKKLRNNL